MQNEDVLKASLAAVARDGSEFCADVLADLGRHHATSATALPFKDAAGMWAALQRFAGAPTPSASAATPSPAVVAFADSLMKVFAKRLGRVEWTPGMALAWNSTLRAFGDRLLAG
ncbi:MAG: hypothetical protein IPH13_04100 [Planctomycetes bacterium]|nr:hypothetical protein [Planctomycetota bacterium]MCC7170720.1 hypothetical protein [Planctomycetota bacterium]